MEKLFVNQTIIDIKIYNVNDNYIEFNNGYSIDGAIEIYLTEKILTIGWDFEFEMFKYRESKYSEPFNCYELDINYFNDIKNLIGNKIRSIEFIRIEYEAITDYTLKSSKEKLISGFIINFSNNLKLKVLASDFEVDKDKKIPQNVIPNIQGYLLIDIGDNYYI